MIFPPRVAAGDEVAQRRLLLPPADRGAAAREDDALDARDARGLEDVEGADDVGPHEHLRRVLVARGGRQVHDRVDVLEGRLDRGEVAEVGLVRLDAGTARRFSARSAYLPSTCFLSAPPMSR